MLTYWLLNAHHSWSYLAPNHIPSQAYLATKINFFTLSLHPSLPLYMLFMFILPLLENSYDSLKPNLMSLMISFSVKPSLASLIRVGYIFPTLLLTCGADSTITFTLLNLFCCLPSASHKTCAPGEKRLSIYIFMSLLPRSLLGKHRGLIDVYWMNWSLLSCLQWDRSI